VHHIARQQQKSGLTGEGGNTPGFWIRWVPGQMKHQARASQPTSRTFACLFRVVSAEQEQGCPLRFPRARPKKDTGKRGVQVVAVALIAPEDAASMAAHYPFILCNDHRGNIN